ncbi:hypothetical protein M9458_022270 [Cirrhinus mrigala]|uniref:G-protein coupled receptors family 1 profile domain-containing protein n=1 Tax=Cirrhinus mrigala TaxID=683832 RepID=A0ABD0Q9G4_CIRMR
MLPNNWTAITEFIIVGFPGLHPDYYGLVSAIFFVVYTTTVAGNTVFLVLFITSESLRKPMYIILASLAMSDMCFSTVALPKIIARYWFNAGATPFHACFFQMELIHYFGTLNSLIMMIMALDRYVAICYSLRYQAVMTNRITYILNATAWVSAFIAPTIATLHTQQLPYCGPKLIIQCYCDHISITNLACAENSKQMLVALCVALLVLLLPLAFIIYSYCHIIASVMRLVSPPAAHSCASLLCFTQFPANPNQQRFQDTPHIALQPRSTTDKPLHLLFTHSGDQIDCEPVAEQAKGL